MATPNDTAIQNEMVMALAALQVGEPGYEADPLLAALAELIDTAGLAHILNTLRDAADVAADAGTAPLAHMRALSALFNRAAMVAESSLAGEEGGS